MVLLFGAFLVLLAVVATCTGDVWAGHGSTVCRNEDPKEFWSVVTVYYVAGLGIIAYYVCRAYGISI
jgi:hypothetical protein